MANRKEQIGTPTGSLEVDFQEPLQYQQRGAILSHATAFRGDYPFQPGTHGLAFEMFGMMQKLSGHDFYPLLLLFEAVEVPNWSNINADPEFQFLSQNQHLRNTRVTIRGEATNAVARRVAFDVWRLRNQSQPGAWSIWHFYSDDAIPEDCTDPALGFQVKLQNSIVLPDPNLPVDDLLAFRKRRHSD